MSYLPKGSLHSFSADETIYHSKHGADHLYLVASGHVIVSRLSDPEKPAVLAIYQAGELFGETSFLGSTNYGESATAVGNVTVRAWPVAMIEELAQAQPKLGIALCRIMAERSTSFEARIACFAVDTIPRRIARSLISLSERMGQQRTDGAITILPLTHQLLAQYVGTSREIVTRHMNMLRRSGYLKYSRQGIQIYREALEEMLRKDNSSDVSAISDGQKQQSVRALVNEARVVNTGAGMSGAA